MKLAFSSLHAFYSQIAVTRLPLVAAALVGIVLVLGSGFSHSEVIHNAAHDVRHANAFPCH